jgi:hypothetical protein
VVIRAFVEDLDVRDGAFDLAIVTDLADLNDPQRAIARLRRAVTTNGAVVAMGRAELPETVDQGFPFPTDLGPAALEYGELYDLFATQFEEVLLAGIVPFRGVVFAELGRAEDESPAVSVDTRLAPHDFPSAFVIVAGQRSAAVERPALDPFAIVQVPDAPSGGMEPGPEPMRVFEAALVTAQRKIDLLAAELDGARERIARGDMRSAEAVALAERAAAERDGALTRAMELEAVLAVSQQTMGTLERRLLEAEQGMLERDDRIAVLSADIDARRSGAPPLFGPTVETVDLGELLARTERAEAALASNVAELAQVADAHTKETANFEEQLRERARYVASLERSSFVASSS